MNAATKSDVDGKIRESLESMKPGAVESAGKSFDDLNMSLDLGLDSLDVINVLFQLEETFGIKVPDDDDKLLVVGSLSDFIVAKGVTS